MCMLLLRLLYRYREICAKELPIRSRWCSFRTAIFVGSSWRRNKSSVGGLELDGKRNVEHIILLVIAKILTRSSEYRDETLSTVNRRFRCPIRTVVKCCSFLPRQTVSLSFWGAVTSRLPAPVVDPNGFLA